jgi:hypothetical protein
MTSPFGPRFLRQVARPVRAASSALQPTWEAAGCNWEQRIPGARPMDAPAGFTATISRFL